MCCLTLDHGFKSHRYIYKYTSKKCSAAILATKMWIWGIHSMQATMHTIKGSTLTLKSRAEVTRSQKQGYQWPHKRTYVLQIFLKNKECTQMEYPFVYIPGLHSISFKHVIISTWGVQEWAKCSLLRGWVVNYRIIRNFYLNLGAQSVISYRKDRMSMLISLWLKECHVRSRFPVYTR